MSMLVERIVALHLALVKARLPHAFGGALALAWCTERARGTIDIDPVSYTHLRAHETVLDLVCRLLLEKKKKNTKRIMATVRSADN